MNQNALWVRFDQHRFVLGMEWRMLQPAEKLVRSTLSQMRREGMQWYVSSGLQDVVGLCSGIEQARQPMHSAALHLASQWSNGGLELFVFGMAEQRVAVVGLNDRRPLPGFDFIGSLAEAQDLIEEFEAIQQGEVVRRVGDLGLLADEERLSAQTVFDQPSADSRLKKIPSLRALIYIGAVLLLMLGCMGGFYYWQQQDRANTLANLPVPVPTVIDPNPAYNQHAAQQIQALPMQGQALYQAWVQLSNQLPLSHQGWVLTQIECKAELCSADWRRQFGSVDDFFAKLPVGASTAKHLPVDKDALTHHLHTSHATPPQTVERHYEKTADLLQAAEGFRGVSSWLQDLSLLGARNVQVDKPQIWVSDADAAVLKQPLLKGTWSAELPLTVSSDLVIPPYATVTLFKTTLSATYQLTGDYYVRSDFIP
jgi:hypothetical protein